MNVVWQNPQREMARDIKKMFLKPLGWEHVCFERLADSLVRLSRSMLHTKVTRFPCQDSCQTSSTTNVHASAFFGEVLAFIRCLV